jgi:hypothetical protein
MGDRYSPTKVSDSCWDAELRKVDSVQLRERITTHPEGNCGWTFDGANNGQVPPDAVAFKFVPIGRFIAPLGTGSAPGALARSAHTTKSEQPPLPRSGSGGSLNRKPAIHP